MPGWFQVFFATPRWHRLTNQVGPKGSGERETAFCQRGRRCRGDRPIDFACPRIDSTAPATGSTTADSAATDSAATGGSATTANAAATSDSAATSD